MKSLDPSHEDPAALERLAEELRSLSPPGSPYPPEPLAMIHAIEQRSARVQIHRRWLTATTTTTTITIMAAALAVGLLWPRTEAVVGGSSIASSGVLDLGNDSDHSMMLDLGPATGRILSRPGARYSYAPERRTLTLNAGTVIAYITKSGRGFRVESEAEVDLSLLQALSATGDWTGLAREAEAFLARYPYSGQRVSVEALRTRARAEVER